MSISFTYSSVAPINLSRCTSLHHLGFLGTLNHYVITLIGNLPFPELVRTLTLGIYDTRIWVSYKGRFKLLDKHLSRIEYVNLEEVHFKCTSGSWDANEWATKLRGAFPNLAERNLIRVTLE